MSTSNNPNDLSILTRLNEIGRTRRVERGLLCTGNDALNHLMGGGLERGSVTQFYGPSGSGKSVTIGRILGHVSDHGLGTCAFIDADHTAENAVAFWGRLGDLQAGVLIHEPETTEEALTVALAMAGAADLVVVDSLGAWDPQDPSSKRVGEVVRSLAAAADRSGAVVLVTNQIRRDIKRHCDVPLGGTHAIYHCSKILRLEAHPLRSKGVRVGVKIAAEVEKARIGPLRGATGTWDLEYLK
jgi:DNA repair protein RadB